MPLGGPSWRSPAYSNSTNRRCLFQKPNPVTARLEQDRRRAFIRVVPPKQKSPTRRDCRARSDDATLQDFTLHRLFCKDRQAVSIDASTTNLCAQLLGLMLPVAWLLAAFHFGGCRTAGAMVPGAGDRFPARILRPPTLALVQSRRSRARPER